jgi:hypothetical protein
MQLVSENTTNIESYEKETEEKRAQKRGEIYHYPYDRGLCENWKDIFGSQIHLWLWPTPPEGDGLNYLTTKMYDGKR